MISEELKHSTDSVEFEALSGVNGVCTLILNSRGEVLVGREAIAKESHDRQRGQISIPMETLKSFERTNKKAMVLAAITEIITDNNVSVLQQQLYEAVVVGPVQLNNNGITGAIAVFHWKGDPGCMPFEPSVEEEFNGLKWMKPGKVLEDCSVRPFTTVVLNYAEENGLLNGLPDRPMLALYGLKPSRLMEIRENGMHEDVG